MKAILVIDIPKNCITCQFRFSKWNEDVGTFHICSICDERLREEDFGENRADFCPLKPMPQRKEETRGITRRIRDTRFESGYYEEMIGVKKDEHAEGWNACIEDILGEEE